jgi:hypothetical protein
MDNMIKYIQDHIDLYAGTPFPNAGSISMRDYWIKQMTLYKAFKRGEAKASELDLDLRDKMSGWVMPPWGYARS